MIYSAMVLARLWRNQRLDSTEKSNNFKYVALLPIPLKDGVFAFFSDFAMFADFAIFAKLLFLLAIVV
jgi:hypothetical protein